jgi:hypothetical protein
VKVAPCLRQKNAQRSHRPLAELVRPRDDSLGPTQGYELRAVSCQGADRLFSLLLTAKRDPLRAHGGVRPCGPEHRRGCGRQGIRPRVQCALASATPLYEDLGHVPSYAVASAAALFALRRGPCVARALSKRTRSGEIDRGERRHPRSGQLRHCTRTLSVSFPCPRPWLACRQRVAGRRWGNWDHRPPATLPRVPSHKL